MRPSDFVVTVDVPVELPEDVTVEVAVRVAVEMSHANSVPSACPVTMSFSADITFALSAVTASCVPAVPTQAKRTSRAAPRPPPKKS
jgi:hypothetical protein